MAEWDAVSEFVRITDEYTDAPKILKEIAALSALSAVVGRNAVVPQPPKRRLFTESINRASGMTGMYLNLYVFVIGESRLTRKTTTANFMRDLIVNVDKLLPLTESFTPEALLEDLKERNPVQAIWILDEAARFLEVCRKKEYMAGAETILQQIYDGHTISHRTKTSGIITIHSPYLCVFFATTPYVIEERLIEPADFHHGFLNRFLIFRVKPPQKPRFNMRTSATLRYGREAARLVKWFRELYKINQTILIDIPKPLWKELTEYNESLWDKTLGATTLQQGYYGNFPDFLFKLCGLYRLSRLTRDEFQEPLVFIDYQDYERAKELLDYVAQSFHEVETAITRQSRTKPYLPPDTSEWEDLVLRILEKDFKGAASRSELYLKVKKYGLNAESLDNVLKELYTAGFIKYGITRDKGQIKQWIILEKKGESV